MLMLALMGSFANSYTQPMTEADRGKIRHLIYEFAFLAIQIPGYHGPALEAFIVAKKATIRSHIRRGRMLMNQHPDDIVVQEFAANCDTMEQVLNHYT